MKTARTLIHIAAFTVLFVAYSMPGQVERPAGVRRALQIFDTRIPASALQPPAETGAMLEP